MRTVGRVGKDEGGGGPSSWATQSPIPKYVERPTPSSHNHERGTSIAERGPGEAPSQGRSDVRVKVRLTPWFLIVPGSLLFLASFFLLGLVIGPESDAQAFLITGLSLAAAALIALAWGWPASAGLNGWGSLYVHYPGWKRSVYLKSLRTVKVWPRGVLHSNDSMWRFKLIDSSGQKVTLQVMAWQDEWILFRAVAGEVHGSQYQIDIDPLTRKALWTVAGFDPARVNEAPPKDAPPAPKPALGRHVLAVAISTLFYALATQFGPCGANSP